MNRTDSVQTLAAPPVARLITTTVAASVVVDAHGDSLDELEVVELRLVPAPAKPTK